MTSATLDRRKPYESRVEKSAFMQARRAELGYARQLRSVARNVGQFISSLFPKGEPGSPDALATLHRVLRGYAEVLRPWAAASAARMIADVSRRDLNAWRRHGEHMSRALYHEVRDTPVGDVVRARLAEQVKLITSLPIEAAERVHKLALEGLVEGRRASEIATEIMKSGDVTVSRANLISRTEVGRTAAEFTRARAAGIGSTHFLWQSAQDVDVRPLHKKLNGTVHKWDEPPISGENGERSLPGAIYNCRCVAIPITPDFL